VRLEWDDEKDHDNRRKHGISFEEAGRLFTSGVDYLVLFDERHSIVEDRFLAIGPLAGGIVLIVWTEPDEDAIRIISARLATRSEQELYEFYRESRR
jgi:uncharacterized DUF497 family protein